MPVTRQRLLALITLLCFIVAVASDLVVEHAKVSRSAVANLAISGVILLVAIATLIYAVPQRARLVVDRLDEADFDDLIFYIYPQPNLNGEQQVPVDYLLQLHVAVSNLGGRKAVLSRIELNSFQTQEGQTVHLPEAPSVIGGLQWIQRSGWVDGQFHTENMNVPGPYVLEPDDVIVVRFRTRRGIDWSSRWTTDSLRSFCEPLRSPIVSAMGTIAWRRGGDIVQENFTVPVHAVQQADYVDLVGDLTQSFTVMPSISERTFLME